MRQHSFSKRTAWEQSTSGLQAAVNQARRNEEFVDLTITNPTVCGFECDANATLKPLSDRRALLYDPDPRGIGTAREAVAAYYADHGASVDMDAMILAASTSEAYSYLFRLLCDPEDEVLVAKPSYPLFELLADLDSVVLKTYPLFYDFGWWIDLSEMEQRIGSRTRAVLLVHPNNPTGHWTHQAEREQVERLCAKYGLALIVDEVFLDYPLEDYPLETGGAPVASFACGPHPALTFVLSGASKIVALPQMKVAWICAFGPQEAVQEAIGRLDLIADTFLSVSAPAQLALPSWLEARRFVQQQIAARTQANLLLLRASGLEVLRAEAGWSALVLLRSEAFEPGESFAVSLLRTDGVLVHPGEFYGIEDRRIVMFSLLTPSKEFRSGVDRIVQREYRAWALLDR